VQNYLSVNVYPSRSGWLVVTRLMRPGGRTPSTVSKVSEHHLTVLEEASLAEAVSLASVALSTEAARLRRLPPPQAGPASPGGS